MKKYILAASCAILSTTAVMAQTSSENDNAGSVSNTSTLTLNLDNVITMSESLSGMSATFHTASEYNSGLNLSSGAASAIPNIKNTFTVQSNRYFNVQVSGTNFTATNTVAGEDQSDNTVMDLSDEGGALIHCTVTDNGSHPSQGAPTSVNLSTSNQTILSNGHNGGDQAFDLAFFANPGWNYAGGTYASTVTVTATQE